MVPKVATPAADGGKAPTVGSAPAPSGAQPVPLRPAAPAPAPAPAAPPPSVRPPAGKAKPKLRHRVFLSSFVGLVLLPCLIWSAYLWGWASDQYVTTVGFSVRNEKTPSATDILGGLSPFAGNISGASDTDILYEFIRSGDMVDAVDKRINLREIFSREWPRDFVFAMSPEEPLEDMTKYWHRKVEVLYDTATGLITLNVAAFTPQDALSIAEVIFEESSKKINELSAIARDDVTRLAKADLETARAELTQSRQALTAFRMLSQIVDPQADLESQMGVLGALQGQLAEQLVLKDQLQETSAPEDPRIAQANRRIDALRRLIDSERRKFGVTGQGPAGESYAEMMAEFEKLQVDLEFSEGSYRSARLAYDQALAEAQRQTRYLAAHITPKIAQSSQEPQRFWLLFVVAGFLSILWAIAVLVYYSIRDRG